MTIIRENKKFTEKKWTVIDNKNKSRKTTVTADNREEALDKGASALKTTGISVYAVKDESRLKEEKEYDESDFAKEALKIIKSHGIHADLSFTARWPVITIESSDTHRISFSPVKSGSVTLIRVGVDDSSNGNLNLIRSDRLDLLEKFIKSKIDYLKK